MNSNINDEYRNNIVLKLNKFIDDETKSRMIEKSIYNHSIKISKQKNINRSWENEIFKELYLSKIRSLYSNINKDSYIKNSTFLERIKSDKIDLACELQVNDWKGRKKLELKVLDLCCSS